MIDLTGKHVSGWCKACEHAYSLDGHHDPKHTRRCRKGRVEARVQFQDGETVVIDNCQQYQRFPGAE